MEVYFWIAIAIIALALIVFSIGLFVSLSIIKPKRRSLLETSILEEEKYPGIMDFYQKNLTDSYQIQSRYGYDISLYYLKNEIDTNKFLVMSHGHTYTHHGCLKYARMMMRYGYNIVMYDQRFHGDSGGKFTSLGHYEKFDLYDIISDTFERFGYDIELGTYGESMGSATVILEADIDQRVKYVFSDCGFKRLDSLVKEILGRKVKKSVNLIMAITRPIFKLLTKVDISRISPIQALHAISIPVFFAHGLADDFIASHHSVDMYNSYDGPKKLFLANNDAKHAGAYLMDQENYELSIDEFMKENILK